jgi:hypothetical protein
LTNNEVKQAFYDAMPVVWRDRFVASGTSMNVATAEMVRYFRNQENAAIRKERENTRLQRNSAIKRRSPQGSSKETKSFSGKFIDKTSGKRVRISNDDPCPFHPDLPQPHLWGDCRNNAYGRNPDKGKHYNQGFKKPRTSKSDEANKQATVAQVNLEADDVAINDVSMTNVNGTASDQHCQVNVNINTDPHLDTTSFAAAQSTFNSTSSECMLEYALRKCSPLKT